MKKWGYLWLREMPSKNHWNQNIEYHYAAQLYGIATLFEIQLRNVADPSELLKYREQIERRTTQFKQDYDTGYAATPDYMDKTHALNDRSPMQWIASMLLTVKYYITDAGRLDDICGWLKGSGNLELSNRAGGYYKARVNNQVSFNKLLRTNPHMSFTVIFRCHPFWYYKKVSNITVQTSGSFVTNPGSVWSEPVLTVYGTGDADLMVGPN